uniref:Ig-like domain-containing protein n=1 Tax=Nothobranchius furzeri TaxID=105023 RepID=A0A8C6VVX6_NOTFU
NGSKFAFLVPGISLGLEVRQSPSDLFTNPDGKVQVFCTHDKTDFRLMLWYQRSPGDTALKLIGYLYHKAVSMEDQYKDGFDLTGDLGGDATKNGSLLIKHVKPGQSAVYFCAASRAQ